MLYLLCLIATSFVYFTSGEKVSKFVLDDTLNKPSEFLALYNQALDKLNSTCLSANDIKELGGNGTSFGEVLLNASFYIQETKKVIRTEELAKFYGVNNSEYTNCSFNEVFTSQIKFKQEISNPVEMTPNMKAFLRSGFCSLNDNRFAQKKAEPQQMSIAVAFVDRILPSIRRLLRLRIHYESKKTPWLGECERYDSILKALSEFMGYVIGDALTHIYTESVNAQFGNSTYCKDT